MNDIAYESDRISGPEPIHRTATKRNALIVTAYGNQAEDRWVLGWRVAAGTKWQDVFHLAIVLAYELQSSKSQICAYTVFDDQFEKAAALAEGRHATVDMISRIESKLGRRQPEMLVLDSRVFQLEVLFEPESCNPNILTVLTGSRRAPEMARLVSRWHSIFEFQEEKFKIAGILEKLCNNDV